MFGLGRLGLCFGSGPVGGLGWCWLGRYCRIFWLLRCRHLSLQLFLFSLPCEILPPCLPWRGWLMRQNGWSSKPVLIGVPVWWCWCGVQAHWCYWVYRLQQRRAGVGGLSAGQPFGELFCGTNPRAGRCGGCGNRYAGFGSQLPRAAVVPAVPWRRMCGGVMM